jgi:hypothetical protein
MLESSCSTTAASSSERIRAQRKPSGAWLAVRLDFHEARYSWGAQMDEIAEEIALPWYQRHKSLRYWIVESFSKLTRGKVRSPLYHSQVERCKQRDLEDCETARISPEEHVKIWSLWTVEFYTPDNINGLYKSLDRLEPTLSSCTNRLSGDWLREARSQPGSSACFILVPKGRRVLEGDYWCTLPQYADHAICSIVTITPSLTLLVSQFAMLESDRLWLDRELHRDHPTSIKQIPSGGIAISDPGNEKQRLVREKRESWLDQATAWHRSIFPGLLSTNGEQVSACEVSTVEGTSAFLGDGQSSNLLAALNLDWPMDVFECRAEEGAELFQFRFASRFNHPSEMMFLSQTETQTSSQNVDNVNDYRPKIAQLNETLSHTFATAALLRVLRFYTRRVTLARDEAAAIVGSKFASKALSRLRADTARCIDASIVSRQLRDAVEIDNLNLDGMEFTGRANADEKTSVKLLEAVRVEIKEQSQGLLMDVDALYDNLHTQANLLSAHANLKVQPWIIVLAVLSLIATVAAAIGPIKQLVSSNVAKPEKSATDTKR